MAREAREPEVKAVTIIGKLIPTSPDSYLRLVYLAHRFRYCLQRAVKMYGSGVDRSTIVKATTRELNLGYADAISKMAKLIVEGARVNSSNQLKIKIRKLFIAGRGVLSEQGQQKYKVGLNRYVASQYTWLWLDMVWCEVWP